MEWLLSLSYTHCYLSEQVPHYFIVNKVAPEEAPENTVAPTTDAGAMDAIKAGSRDGQQVKVGDKIEKL